MPKKLVVIGAGEAARPILQKAKEMGVTTYCFSTVKGALAKDLSDHFYPVSIFDIDSIEAQCRKIVPDGVIASSEITTQVAAILADKLKLPGNDIKDGFAAQNKYVMRNRAASCSYVSQPEFFLYEEKKQINYPVVVKSTDSAGKKGINLVRSEDQLQTAVSEAAQYSSDRKVLIEEYIDGGQEYSAECLAFNGNVQVVQITEKNSYGPPHFVELGHHQPAKLGKAEMELIYSATAQLLPALGIKNSIAHLEFKLLNGKFYFIEVGARGGGDFISEYLVGLSTDFDYFKAAIETAFGEYVFKPSNAVAYSGVYWLCKQSEELLPMFKAAFNKPWCIKCEINNTELSEIKGNSDEKSGYLIYRADRKITPQNFSEV